MRQISWHLSSRPADNVATRIPVSDLDVDDYPWAADIDATSQDAWEYHVDFLPEQLRIHFGGGKKSQRKTTSAGEFPCAAPRDDATVVARLKEMLVTTRSENE